MHPWFTNHLAADHRRMLAEQHVDGHSRRHTILEAIGRRVAGLLPRER
jgi:hypothetical protein